MDFRRVREFIDSLEEGYGVPGCQVMVSCRGECVLHHTAGFRDGARQVPVSGEDMYILYSASKVITNVAMMRLVEQGRLRLEDRVEQYLPEFADLTVREGDGVRPAREKLTVEHLSTMCGGLTYNLDTPYIRRAIAQGRRSTRELVAAIAQEPLLFDPGSDYNYSLCHDVIGAIIEVVSGVSFGEFLRREIFDPLGMVDTTFRISEQQRARLTAQYLRREDGSVVRVEDSCAYALTDEYESGGAGLYSTARDYFILAQTLANGGRTLDGSYQLLKRETVALMARNRVFGACRASFDKIGRTGYGYGLGVRTMLEPRQHGYRTPVGEFGWDGAASSYVSISPEAQVAIFFGMQVLGHGPIYAEVHPVLRELVYEALLGDGQPREGGC